jgi:hypothetical protein
VTMTRASDAHRREIDDARRWAAQLEGRLSECAAALELERDENSRLDKELNEMRLQLSDVTGVHGVNGDVSSTPLPQASTASGGTHHPSRISRARALASKPIIWEGAAPAAAERNDGFARTAPSSLLVVGAPARPEDVTLRLAPVFEKPTSQPLRAMANPSGKFAAFALEQHQQPATAAKSSAAKPAIV